MTEEGVIVRGNGRVGGIDKEDNDTIINFLRKNEGALYTEKFLVKEFGLSGAVVGCILHNNGDELQKVLSEEGKGISYGYPFKRSN